MTAEMTVDDSASSALPLAGVRICLVFEFSLSHYTRLRQEIAALQDAGATVEVLTSNTEEDDAPEGVEKTVTLLHFVDTYISSPLTWRPARALHNRALKFTRWYTRWFRPGALSWERKYALRCLSKRVDLFWVIDEPSLPSVMAAAKRAGVRVVYETVDLVPEYVSPHRNRRLAEEARLIPRVDGFITACDSYADYYMERYGESGLQRRPLVRDNMPPEIASAPSEVRRPLRILFFGSLMYDRPVRELIRAMALVQSDVVLTFQGKNLLPASLDGELANPRISSRVHLVDPCPPDEIVTAAHRHDIGIVALRGVNENERRASTSKLFTYMSAGLAVLGSDLPGISRVIDAHGNGALVKSMDPAAWAAAIDAMAALSNEEIQAMKQRSIDAARLYAWERQKPRFVAEFRRALDG